MYCMLPKLRHYVVDFDWSEYKLSKATISKLSEEKNEKESKSYMHIQ